MGAVAAELVSLLAVAHGLLVAQVESQRVQGLLDFLGVRLPKFGIAFSSDSERWTRSPTVCIPARLRQL